MTFSASAKNEICSAAFKSCCATAELCAFTFTCGTLSINLAGRQIKYTTENMTVAKHIFDILKKTFDLETDIVVSETQLKKKNLYTVVANDAQAVFDAIGAKAGMLPGGELQDGLLKKSCCKTAFLRGAFLGSGTVSDPQKNYHLEFVLNSAEVADVIIDLLRFFEIDAKKIARKHNYVVYLSEGDRIVSLLALIGAHASILNFENIRVLKELRNNVNRAVNCETANINKTVNAAITQLNNIKQIENTIGLKALSSSLREAAQLRLDNPEASLKELCEMCGITKSAMNHRFRKIAQIALLAEHKRRA